MRSGCWQRVWTACRLRKLPEEVLGKLRRPKLQAIEMKNAMITTHSDAELMERKGHGVWPGYLCKLGYYVAMTKLLEQAFTEAQSLSESEQDAIARLLLDEIEAERRWDESFARAPQKLGELADTAWSEHEAGRLDRKNDRI
jgi:hypothetical protein